MDALDRFAPIALDELISEAALLTRVDRKYIVPRERVPHVLDSLASDTRALQIDGARSFSYASVYFDTPDLLSYHQAAQPRRRRFKIRTRSYESTGGAFLEIKTRGARGATQKQRAPYASRLDELPVEAHAEIREALDSVGVDGDVVAELRATLTSRYRRATLLDAESGARATIDTDLHWHDHDGGSLTLPAMSIIETKSGSRASDVDRRLWQLGHRPQSISKYATGMAALRPHLPSNKWTRVLRGPFAQATPPQYAGAFAAAGGKQARVAQNAT